MSTAITTYGLSDEEVDLVKNTVAKGSTDEELSLFLYQAQKAGLDPLSKQIYFVKYGTSVSIQTGVDGLRTIAQRTGEYGGQDGPYWCDMTGQWYDVWLQPTPPAAAKVGVLRRGFAQPLYRVATWAEFAGNTNFWRDMPSQMLAKVAESQALRAAFPQELSGLYSGEEMDQAGQPVVIEAPPEIEFQNEDGSHVDALVDQAVEMGAEVVDPDRDAKLRTELDSIDLINLMYDDNRDYINKILDHYDVDTWLDLSMDEALEIYNTLYDRRKKLIGSTRLKRLHALGNEVQTITEDDWLWDEVRPVYVNQLTQGRTTSSKKLFVDEWQQIVEFLEAMLVEDGEGETPFDD